ncbi:hypothetical protein KKB55_01540 [Myxococcota bacterium]|nr:hypothetical protein [Myxococcota bacterium]
MSIERILLVGFDETFLSIKGYLSKLDEFPTFIEVNCDGSRTVKVYTRLLIYKQTPLMIVINDILSKIDALSLVKIIRSIDLGFKSPKTPILFFTDQEREVLDSELSRLGNMIYLNKNSVNFSPDKTDEFCENIEKIILKLRESS